MATSDQCAVAADGSLLNASAIVFYNDPDDDTPLPTTSTSNSTPLPSIQVHPFFQGVPVPSKIVAVSRRSTRTVRPSTRITDPNNTEAPRPATTCKRSATTAPAGGPLRTARRAKLTDSDGESEYDDEPDNGEVDVGDGEDIIGMGNPTSSEEGDVDGINVKGVEEAYRATKVMGDADRQVCLKSVVQVHTNK